jgi:hypothetical protein
MKRLGVITLFMILSIACATILPTTTNAPTPESVTGSISGNVLDEDGSPIPLANIVTQPPTSVVVSDEQGAYSISEIPSGNYIVTSEKAGYKNRSVEVAVTVGGTTTADLLMAQTSSQTAQPLFFEQFETANLGEDWLILDQAGTISVNNGILSLSGGGQGHKRINTRQEFSATVIGVSTKARIKLTGDYQKFGFGVNAVEFPSPTAGFYFDTRSRFDSSGGSENATYLLVTDIPNGRESQTFILKKQVPVTWNEFHEFEVVWTNSMVSFYIDDELQASVPYTFGNSLPVGVWNDRGQHMQTDWVEVQEILSLR